VEYCIPPFLWFHQELLWGECLAIRTKVSLNFGRYEIAELHEPRDVNVRLRFERRRHAVEIGHKPARGKGDGRCDVRGAVTPTASWQPRATVGGRMSIEHDIARELRADRHSLIAYLRYAVEELAVVNETSAALVRMAISSLEEEVTIVPSENTYPRQ
jgi:hypothetical protein